jgi:hypothetical protein
LNVDFKPIHTYPVWEYKNIHEALEYTKENFCAVGEKISRQIGGEGFAFSGLNFNT